MKPLLLAAAFALAGCASSTAANGDRPPVRSADVVFYRSPDDVPGEFEVIEQIVPPADVARTGSGYDDTDAVERFVRRRAARVGANGVLFMSTPEASSEVQTRTTVRNGYTLTPGNWVAIYVASPAGSR